jgi:hypothetical protein
MSVGKCPVPPGDGRPNAVSGAFAPTMASRPAATARREVATSSAMASGPAIGARAGGRVDHGEVMVVISELEGVRTHAR